jgi:hypothetical protein
MKTLSGLRSRWTMFFRCAAASTTAICRVMATALAKGSGDSRASRCARLSPSRSYMMM